MDDGNDKNAIELFLKVIELKPENSSSYYNIGLIYKYQNEWQLSLDYNIKAYELNSKDEAARWNMAIAATALGKWRIARQAWEDNGIKLKGGKDPINMDFGQTPVRLNPDYEAEVVWANRIDPVRAIINNIPLVESTFNLGDIVLHDGAAVGYRNIRDMEHPVFNVLKLMEPSDYRTIEVKVEIKSDDDLEVLNKLFSETDNEFEDWTNTVRMLCKKCSEGTPHKEHDHELEKQWTAERLLGIATKNSEEMKKILNTWESRTSSKIISS